MSSYNLVIALPTADRSRAYAFAQALGLETPGELAEDGVPEPLRVQLNEQASVMYVPTGGFGWITDGRHHGARNLRVPAQPAGGHHHRGRQPGRARRCGRRSGGVRSRAEVLGLHRNVYRP